MALNDAKTLEGMKGFDLDLKFGKHFEELIDDVFSGVTKAEIKTERDQWVKYGNLAIEIEHRDKPSGLSRTDAEIWVHNLSYKGKLMGAFMIPTDVLKDIVDKAVKNKEARVTNGGDKWASKLVLLPITQLLDFIKRECEDAET